MCRRRRLNVTSYALCLSCHFTFWTVPSTETNCSLVRGDQNLCAFTLSLKVLTLVTKKIWISYDSVNTGVSESKCVARLVLSHTIRQDGWLDTRTDCFTSPLPFESGWSPKTVSKLWKKKPFSGRESNSDLTIMHQFDLSWQQVVGVVVVEEWGFLSLCAPFYIQGAQT
jgi:hypothetical protein